MTDQKQTFTHISVNDGSDDDIVIQAGAPAVASKVARRVSVSADHADIEDGEEAADVSLGEDVSGEVEEDVSYDETYDEDAWSEANEADEAEEVDDSDDFEDATYVYEDEPHEVESAPSQAKKDTYHETTLEDLEDISMSSMQKVVLGVVLAIIAVAVVYFVFFMK